MSGKESQSEDDGLGDFRIRAATRLAADVRAAYPGGPSHKAGAPVYQTTLIRTRSNRLVSFIAPSATALALRQAVTASERARPLREAFKFTTSTTPWGDAEVVADNQLTDLFDYFELCMAAAIFSYLSIEAYCNEVISFHPHELVTIKRSPCGREKKLKLEARKLERQSSTEEKLAVVLPQLLKVDSPKGLAIWANFRKLQKARNDSVHLKAKDANPIVKGADKLDSESLFYQFIAEDISGLPKAAIHMLLHFARQPEVPRWLREPMAVFNIR